MPRTASPCESPLTYSEAGLSKKPYSSAGGRPCFSCYGRREGPLAEEHLSWAGPHAREATTLFPSLFYVFCFLS